jgi:hypothetical protein
MSVLCCTSLTYAGLPQARVLAETVRAAHPDWPLWAVLVDRAPDGYGNRAAFAAFDAVLAIEELGVPDLPRWLFRLDAAQARAAAAGLLLRHLLGLAVESVVYFAPEVALFHPLAALADRLQKAPVLLAREHRADRRAFVAVRNGAAGRAFAEAWAAWTLDADFLSAGAGGPGGVAVVDDPGWNVAGWQLPDRRLRFLADGGLRVDGAPLAFCDFAPARGDDAMAAAHELGLWHARRVAAHAEPGIPDGWWHYATFSDGTPIPPDARRLARERPDVLARFADPFAIGEKCFFGWLTRHAPGVLGGRRAARRRRQ